MEKIPTNNLENLTLPKDSGEMRECDNGVHRDAHKAGEKGRWDLLPHAEVAMVMRRCATMPAIDYTVANAVFCDAIDAFMKDQNIEHLADAICACYYGLDEYKDYPIEYMFLDVSFLYESGAIKYNENNWKRGMPVKWCVDSGGRHFFKARVANQAKREGKDCEYFDEPHYRGPIWNLLCAMWTATNKPEMLKDLVVIA